MFKINENDVIEKIKALEVFNEVRVTAVTKVFTTTEFWQNVNADVYKVAYRLLSSGDYRYDLMVHAECIDGEEDAFMDMKEFFDYFIVD